MINWKLRFQNKTTLIAIITQVVAIIYMALGMAGIVPTVGEDRITALLFMVVELFSLLGIVVDPTTDGVGDSKLAMTYDKPKSIK